jgi:hypothetical protein
LRKFLSLLRPPAARTPPPKPPTPLQTPPQAGYSLLFGEDRAAAPQAAPAPPAPVSKHPAQWKWYFGANRAALRHCRDQIEAAVISARLNTDLVPIFLLDDREDLSIVAHTLAWLERAGVRIIRHRAALFDIVQPHFGPAADPYNGHWLRCDIPLLEQTDDYVLYTDIDVVFRKQLDLDQFSPPFFAAAPEHRVDDFSYFNSGVMVMNVPALRDSRSRLIDTLRERLPRMGAAHDDQGALNDTYRTQYTRLPCEYNWKPYWGFNQAASIVHFHGPKQGVARRMMAGEMSIFNRELQEIYLRNPPGYAAYLKELDELLARGKASLGI